MSCGPADAEVVADALPGAAVVPCGEHCVGEFTLGAGHSPDGVGDPVVACLDGEHLVNGDLFVFGIPGVVVLLDQGDGSGCLRESPRLSESGLDGLATSGTGGGVWRIELVSGALDDGRVCWCVRVFGHRSSV